MTTNGINPEKPLSRMEWLAAMFLFLLPLISLVALFGISLPQWTNYPLLVLIWGCILFAIGFAIKKRLPGWSFPYLGFALMLAIVLSSNGRVWDWIYPTFIKVFGPRSLWPVPIRVIYVGVFEFIMSMTILLGAVILVNLLRLLPYTRVIWERIRGDWTQLSFMLYGGLVFSIQILFEEYRQDDLWKLSAWVCLALGAWLYLRGKGLGQRILALLGGTTSAFWIVALAKWVLIPLQKWPTGYPIAPSEASRWVETGSALLSWLFMLGILSAPALLKWLPPLPVPSLVEQDEPSNAHAV